MSQPQIASLPLSENNTNRTDASIFNSSESKTTNSDGVDHNEETVTLGDSKEDKSGLRMLKSLSGPQKYTLLSITAAIFLAGTAFSIVAPIYPIPASKKGMDTTLIGFVYAMYAIIVFATAPIFGSFLTKIGAKLTFIAGIFVGGCCNVLFGSLYYCPSGTPFIVLSILVRVVEALGFSAYITSSFAIVSSQFKENVGFIFGFLEAVRGLGFMLGPTIGGALYEVGGFGLPFYVAGVTVLLNGILAYKLLPSVEHTRKKPIGSILSLCRYPMILVSAVSLFSSQMAMTAIFSTLAKHLETLDLSVGYIGLLFGGEAFLFSVTAMISGYVSDTLDVQAPVITGGQFVFGVGLLVLGPSLLLPFLPFILATALVGMGLSGIGHGCNLVVTMKCMVNGALEMGFDKNIETFALVSGLYNAVEPFGAFTGAVGFGALTEEYGYPISYTVLGLANISSAMMCVVYFSNRRYRKRKTINEYQNIDE